MNRAFAIVVVSMIAVACGSKTASDANLGDSNAAGSNAAGKCSQGCDAYRACITSACDAEYQAGLGSDYKTGVFVGPCAAYFTCATACGCDDPNCYGACTTSFGDCSPAYTAIADCQTNACTTERAECACSSVHYLGGIEVASCN